MWVSCRKAALLGRTMARCLSSCGAEGRGSDSGWDRAGVRARRQLTVVGAHHGQVPEHLWYRGAVWRVWWLQGGWIQDS